MKFPEVKSDTLNLRVSPAFKLALKAAAEHEQRSMVNMLQVLVAAFCDGKGIVLTTPQRAARTQHKPRIRSTGERRP